MKSKEFRSIILLWEKKKQGKYSLFEKICPAESAVNNFHRNAYDVKPMKNFKKVVI